MNNRGNNRPHRLTMDNCIPSLTIANNVYTRVENPTAAIPL